MKGRHGGVEPLPSSELVVLCCVHCRRPRPLDRPDRDPIDTGGRTFAMKRGWRFWWPFWGLAAIGLLVWYAHNMGWAG